jgi:hypothetical protein
MAEIYIEVGPMSAIKDPKKVPSGAAMRAPGVMKRAVVAAIRKSAGFTADVPADKGFYIDATLTLVKPTTLQGQPGTSCTINGVVATYPDKKWLTQSLSGSAATTGSKDRDIDAAVEAVMEALTKDKIIPFLRMQPVP